KGDIATSVSYRTTVIYQMENESNGTDLEMLEVVQRDMSIELNCNTQPRQISKPDIKHNYIDAEQASFEEIAGIVSNNDDPSILSVTFRSCFMGGLFTIFLSVINQYFHYRTISYVFPSILLLLFSYPLGKLMAWCLPRKEFNIWRWSFSLNPCQFSMKEHALIFVMSSVAAQNIYSIDIIVIKNIKYNEETSFGLGLFFVISTQVMGYGMAEQSTSLRWLNMSRLKFFILASICQAIYYWLPGYIMPVLTALSWMCMIKPDNVLLSQLTANRGGGIGSLILDWNTVTGSYALLNVPFASPIIVPRWALINILIGFVTIVWIIIPSFYYSNLWNFKRFPIAVNQFYKIENDPTTWLSASSVIAWSLRFSSLPTLFIHTIFYHGKDIIKQCRTSLRKRENDVHCVLMAKYREASEWWYIVIFTTAFVIVMIICHFAQLITWYYLLLAVLFASICLLPIGIVLAVTSINIDVYVIAETLGGSLLHGKTIELSTFVMFAVVVQTQALGLLMNFKLGHYMKLSPRVMFIIQLVITIFSSIIRYITTNNYLLTSIPNLCNSDAWNCTAIDWAPSNFASNGE
ncbi:unnamed protein product, partial [Didymodactylos carnosus]